MVAILPRYSASILMVFLQVLFVYSILYNRHVGPASVFLCASQMAIVKHDDNVTRLFFFLSLHFIYFGWAFFFFQYRNYCPEQPELIHHYRLDVDWETLGNLSTKYLVKFLGYGILLSPFIFTAWGIKYYPQQIQDVWYFCLSLLLEWTVTESMGK